jgi:ketosteroid isomerase-like protein
MTAEETQNLAVVQRTLTGYGRMPIDLWLQDFAADLIYEEPGRAGSAMGRATLREALARQFAAHPEMVFLTQSLLATGDQVVVEGMVQYLDAGNTLVRHQVLIYNLHGGKIRRLRVYTQAHDTAAKP